MKSGRSNRCRNQVASGLLPFAMSEFFSGVQETNLLRIKNTSLQIVIYSLLLLCVTRYLSNGHVRLVFSLKCPLPWLKLDAKWFYGMASSRRCRSLTKRNNEQIITLIHRATIPLLVDH